MKWCIGSRQRGQRLREVPCGDPLELRPREQGFAAPRAAQVRRQDLAREFHLLPGVVHALFVDSRLADCRRPDARLQHSLRHVAIAHDEAVTVIVEKASGLANVPLDLGLERGRKHLLGSLAEEVGDHVAGPCFWNENSRDVRRHMRRTPSLCGETVTLETIKSTPLFCFSRSSTNSSHIR